MTTQNSAVERLEKEYRRRGSLEVDDVLNICTRMGLDASDIASVRGRLEQSGLLPIRTAKIVEGWTPPDDDDNVHFRPTDIVAEYLHDVGRHPLLMPEDEVRLGRRIAAARELLQSLIRLEGKDERRFLGKHALDDVLDEPERTILIDGIRAEEQLYLSNLRLVISIAKQYERRAQKLDLLDLVQAGNEGLIRAVQKFDHTRGFKFSTYATWWIKQHVNRYLADMGRTIRLPVHVVQSISAVRQAERTLTSDHGEKPSLEQLAAYLDDKPAHVQALIDWSNTTRSLDAQIAEGLTEYSRTASGAPDPLEAALHRDESQRVHELINRLDARSAEIVCRRFGIGHHEKQTLEQIGNDLGVTRERIRQIEATAKKRLGTMAVAEGLRELRQFAF